MSLLLLMGLTAVANVWGVQSLNHRVLPQATQTASEVLERDVSSCAPDIYTAAITSILQNQELINLWQFHTLFHISAPRLLEHKLALRATQ